VTNIKTQTRSVKGTNLLLAIFDTYVEVFTSAILNFDAVLCNASKNPQSHKNLYSQILDCFEWNVGLIKTSYLP